MCLKYMYKVIINKYRKTTIILCCVKYNFKKSFIYFNKITYYLLLIYLFDKIIKYIFNLIK